MDFDFMDPPPEDTLLSAMYQLWVLGALDDLGRLTQMGRKMAEFPLDPSMSRILLVSERLGCSEEALSVVAMLSVPKIFSRPKNQEIEADAMKEKLMVPESDHLSLYNVYKTWQQNGESAEWSAQHFIQNKSLKKVKEVRSQLRDIMISQKMKLVSCEGDQNLLRRAVCAGFFGNAARIKTIGKYRHLRTNLNCSLHPSSALYLLGYPPDYVVYHELLMTSQEFMLCVTTVDPLWLAEFGSVFYGLKDSEKYESMFKQNLEERDAVSGVPGHKRSFAVFEYGEDGQAHFGKEKGSVRAIAKDLDKRRGGVRQMVLRPGVRRRSGQLGKMGKRNYLAEKFAKYEIGRKRRVILEVDECEEEDLESSGFEKREGDLVVVGGDGKLGESESVAKGFKSRIKKKKGRTRIRTRKRRKRVDIGDN